MMHALVAYDRATLRISEMRPLSERERRVRLTDDLDDATARVRFPGRTSPSPDAPRPAFPVRSPGGLSR